MVAGAKGPVIKPLEAAVRMAALVTIVGVVSLVARLLTPMYKTMTSPVMRLSTLVVEMASLVTKPSTLVAKAVSFDHLIGGTSHRNNNSKQSVLITRAGDSRCLAHQMGREEHVMSKPLRRCFYKIFYQNFKRKTFYNFYKGFYCQ